MSGVTRAAKKAGDKVRSALGLKQDSAPAAQVQTPTIDDAQRSLQNTDRLMRRKGVLANIFAGTSGGAPQVGKSKLGA